MSRSQLQCNEASGFSLIKLVSVYECVPIQNQSVFSFIQYLKVVRHKLCIKVMITMPTQTLAVIQLPRHKPLTSTTPRSWAVYLSSSMQWHWHWKTSWHLVTCGHVMAGVWNVNDETHHIWMSTQQNGYMRLGAACSLFLSWEERLRGEAGHSLRKDGISCQSVHHQQRSKYWCLLKMVTNPGS